MDEMENAPAMPGVIKQAIDLDGFILFEAGTTLAGVDLQLKEVMRTTDIVTATNTADAMSRTWPGVKFYLYSGVTGQWYAYFKPIEGAM